MANEQFDIAKAFIPDSLTLLGATLKPLSLGHLVLLEKANCLSLDNWNAMLVCILICSMDYDQFLEAVESNRIEVSGYNSFLNRLAVKCGLAFKEKTIPFCKDTSEGKCLVTLWRESILKGIEHDNTFNMFSIMEQLRLYIESSLANIPIIADKSESKSKKQSAKFSYADLAASVIKVVMSEYNFTESALMNMPLAKSRYWFLSVLEKHDKIKLLSSNEQYQLYLREEIATRVSMPLATVDAYFNEFVNVKGKVKYDADEELIEMVAEYIKEKVKVCRE